MMIANCAKRSNKLARAVAGGLAALCTLGGATTPAWSQARVMRDAAGASEMQVPLGKSQVLRVDRPFTDLIVGNPEVADIMPLTDRSLYVLGKAIGSTNLSIYGQNRTLIGIVDVTVSPDVDGVKARLNDLIQRERIEVRAVGPSIVLSGVVSSPGVASRAAQVAEQFAPGKVTNMLTVAGSQQVMLSVRIAEISRTAARELGIKPSVLFGQTNRSVFGGRPDVTYGEDTVAGLGSVLDPANLSNFAAASLSWATGNFLIDVVIDTLEEKGALKILAEPNLVALSGDTAKFLAGGEFPIPVAQDSDDGNTTLTVEFKQFGVSLAFTPTVLDDGLINLVVAPEVSQIDPTVSVTFNGLQIPGLSTRKATTTVEMRAGQSFAIAGLLQSDFVNQVRQIPGFGDVPVLGALARSSNYERRETELVIIVTPQIVKPVAPDMLRDPTQTFVAPGLGEMALTGRVEGNALTGRDAINAALGSRPEGGLVGSYGYIIK
jgi:pilus assembly protein CpaC